MGLSVEGSDREWLEMYGARLEGPWVGEEELGGLGVGEFLAQGLLRVRGKDGRVMPLRANAAQREFERRRGTGNIVLKARQMGMTTWVAGRLFLKTICRPGTLTLQVAHTQESAEEILGIVHRFWEHLPGQLKVGLLRRGKANVRQMVFPAIDSEFRVESAADRNAGRGMTFQNLHCSEVSRWPGSPAETLAGLRAGLAPGGEQVLESTPNGTGDCFYEEWQRASEVGCERGGLVRHFFPWWMEAGYRTGAVQEETLTVEEWELMEREGLDLEQVGFRRTIQTNFQGMARQEYAEDAESCFRVTGQPYFDMEVVERRIREVRGPMGMSAAEEKELAEKRLTGLKRWLPSQAGRQYIVAVDPAGGGPEGDPSVMEVLDLESGQQCAEYAGYATGHELAMAALQLAWDYNSAHLVVERNNHGHGLLWLLGTEGYRWIFCAADGEAGVLTTSVSRPQMLAGLSAALVDAPGLFRSKEFLVECRSFVRLGGGKVGARSGAHDDRVMAMAVGLAARREILGRRQGPATPASQNRSPGTLAGNGAQGTGSSRVGLG